MALFAVSTEMLIGIGGIITGLIGAGSAAYVAIFKQRKDSSIEEKDHAFAALKQVVDDLQAEIKEVKANARAELDTVKESYNKDIKILQDRVDQNSQHHEECLVKVSALQKAKMEMEIEMLSLKKELAQYALKSVVSDK